MVKYRVIVTNKFDEEFLNKSYDSMGNNNPFTSLLENQEFLEDISHVKSSNPKEWKWYFYQETPISGIDIEEFTKEIPKEILYNSFDIDDVCRNIHEHLKGINLNLTDEVKEYILELIRVNL